MASRIYFGFGGLSRGQDGVELWERMSGYAALLARQIGLDHERAQTIRLASLLHDVGNAAVPDRILGKRGPLTPGELEALRFHTEHGAGLLAAGTGEYFEVASIIALTHHEHFDGSGYPRGLSGDQIPLEGRIAAIADSFDALTSDRMSRRGRPLPESIHTLRAATGTHLDPELVDLFLADLDEVLAIHDAHPTGTPSRRARPRRTD